MVELLEKELKKLEEKKSKAKRDYNDTGYDKHWKIIKKCEDQIAEIDKLMENSKSTTVKEFEFLEKINNIKNKVINLRLDYPHEDGLKILANYLESEI